MPNPSEQQPDDFFSFDASSPLADCNGWFLIDNGDDTDALTLWRQAFESLFQVSAHALQERWPLPRGVEAFAILSGDKTSLAWNGDSDAMGFHAMIAQVQDEDDGEYYLDIPDDHRCYVNLRAHDRECREDIPDESSVLAALATLPHEMAHVALFARHTKGKTPLEVFDEGGGEGALIRISRALEREAVDQSGHASKYGGNEDIVENFATDLVSQWHASPHVRDLVDKLVAFIQPKRKLGPSP